MEILQQLKNFIINNDIDSAYKIIMETEKQYRDKSIYWKLKGMLFYNLKKYETAITCYKKAIDIQYDDVDAYFNLAYIHKLINRNLESILYSNIAFRYATDSETKNKLKIYILKIKNGI